MLVRIHIPVYLPGWPRPRFVNQEHEPRRKKSLAVSFAVPDTFTYDDGDANLCLCLADPARMPASRYLRFAGTAVNHSLVRPFVSAPFCPFFPSFSGFDGSLGEFPTAKWLRCSTRDHPIHSSIQLAPSFKVVASFGASLGVRAFLQTCLEMWRYNYFPRVCTNFVGFYYPVLETRFVQYCQR